MTKHPPEPRCPWCGGRVPQAAGAGRPRRFCRRSHRQRYYEARRLASAMGLDTDDVLVSRTMLGALQDRLYALEAALEDVERDLRGRPPAEEYQAAFRHLYAAAAPLRHVGLEPRAIGGREVLD